MRPGEAWVVAPEQRDLRDAFGEVRRKWASRPLGRIEAFQKEGWVRPDLDPDEVRRRMVGAVSAAVLALLADPSPEEQKRQLEAIDSMLESLAAPDSA